MKVGVIGMGYVGVVTAASFAYIGHHVACFDIDKEKMVALNKGKAPVHEDGLEDLIKSGRDRGNLKIGRSVEGVVDWADIVFICVGTPSRSDGSIDLNYVIRAAEDIANALESKESKTIVVTKSTVVPGSGLKVIIPAIERASKHEHGSNWGYASNPEFLREGNAVQDALNPDRIVIGANEVWVRERLHALYANFESPIVDVDITTAEMIKYTANAFLATKISFANEIARLCERVGVDVYKVMDAVAMDKRINREFLNAGVGFGGSCFPKDVRAIIASFSENGIEPHLLPSVMAVNSTQPEWALSLLERALGGSIKGKKIALLGLAFKPGTDDVRESRAYPLVESLVKRGAEVVCYDPVAIDNFKRSLNPEIEKGVDFSTNLYGAIEGANAIIIQTAWEEIKDIDLSRCAALVAEKVILDGRHALDRKRVEGAGFRYIGLGW